jgi:hypothetical protein
MSRVPKMLLAVLLLGVSSCAAGVVLTILANWFFRGQAGISSDEFQRMLVLGFVFALMPLGLFWARK